MNTAILVGNLGEDPELRATGGGQSVLKMRLATTSGYKDRESGEWKESTQWHTVVCWGERAKSLAEILRKGSKVAVRGEIQYRSWDKDDGTKGYATEIRADEIDLCDKRPSGGASQSGGQKSTGQRQGGTAKKQAAQRRPAPQSTGGGYDEADEDNIPETY